MRTALLMLVAVLEETYPAELARYLGSTISSVQRALDKGEDEGLVGGLPRVQADQGVTPRSAVPP
jgi:DNA-binding MarR family transcriptional regulator